MIADAQALTDNADNPEKVRQNIIEVALDYLACGLDPEKSTLLISVADTGAVRAVILLYEPGDSVEASEKSYGKIRNPDEEFRGQYPGWFFHLSDQPGG